MHFSRKIKLNASADRVDVRSSAEVNQICSTKRNGECGSGNKLIRLKSQIHSFDSHIIPKQNVNYLTNWKSICLRINNKFTRPAASEKSGTGSMQKRGSIQQFAQKWLQMAEGVRETGETEVSCEWNDHKIQHDRFFFSAQLNPLSSWCAATLRWRFIHNIFKSIMAVLIESWHGHNVSRGCLEPPSLLIGSRITGTIILIFNRMEGSKK